MADFFTWTAKELGLGVAEMDLEHQELIARMNAIYGAVESKSSVDEIARLIGDLATYTTKHFTDEEAFMQKIGYEGLETHKIIHQQLLKQFGDFVDEFKEKKVVSQAFFNFLKVWLTSHIRGIDMKYANKVKKTA